MARAARLVVPDVALHLVQRGVDRGDCFFTEAHYREYLRLLAVHARGFGCSVHAYCLMTNHVHLLLTPHARGACARLMKQVNQCYVQWLNKATGRTGTLWEGRFRSALVDTDTYALTCYRYIELNPLRAGMVAHPREYRWSSYRGNADGMADPILSPHATYLSLSDCPGKRTLAYRDLFVCTLRETDIEEIRKATRGRRRRSVPN
jgi:putative transposase